MLPVPLVSELTGDRDSVKIYKVPQSMDDLRGCCTNLKGCTIAASRLVVSVPYGARYICPECQSPLLELEHLQDQQQVGSNRKIGWASIAIPFGLTLLLASVVGYRAIDGSSGLTVPQQLKAAFGSAQPVPAQPVIAQPVPTQADAHPAPQALAKVPVPAAESVVAAAVPAAPTPVQAARPTPVPEQVAMAQQPAPVISQPPPPAPAVVVKVLPKKVLLGLAGSDAIGSRLARRMASGYLALIGDSEISQVPGETTRSLEIGGMQTGQREAVVITAGSSASGFTALLRGSADMAMSVRKISPAEQERLAFLGDLTTPASEIVVGLEGIAAIVNPANQVSSLTVPQLRGILAGRIADWSQVGGNPGKIHVYIVDGQGGTTDVPHEILVSQDDALEAASRVPSQQAVADGVASDKSGIGFTALDFTGSTKVLAVAEAGAAPVVPSNLSISTETYPLSRRLYLYAPPGSSNLFVKRFTAYVASVGGQAVVEAAGMVPLTLRAEPEAVPDAASERFKQLVAGTTRLSVNFRFQPGSVDLDGRSLRDLERLAAYLKAQRVSPNRVILAGFADNNGTPAANQIVSQRRVDAVAAALAKAGFAPGRTAVFGAELPVADNATPEGRERNRRVEAYLAGQ